MDRRVALERRVHEVHCASGGATPCGGRVADYVSEGDSGVLAMCARQQPQWGTPVVACVEWHATLMQHIRLSDKYEVLLQPCMSSHACVPHHGTHDAPLQQEYATGQ